MDCSVKLFITGKDGLSCIGPGMCSLLKEVQRTGSVSLAAKSLGISYSKCWKMIKNSELATGLTIVERTSGGSNGGHAVLTEQGIKLIHIFETLDKDVRTYAKEKFDKELIDCH